MISILRKLRQRLIISNHFSKYLLYAIGEIILVVIGILIALQINNWNSQRLQNLEEQRFLNAINNEFRITRDYLLKSVEDNNSAIQIGKELMSLAGANRERINESNTDSLLFAVFNYGGLTITENSVIELLQSGKLQNIRNENLKLFLLEWTQVKDRALSSKKSVDDRSDILVKYLFLKYPLKDIDAYGILDWKEPSKLGGDKLQIFNELQFENIIDDKLYNLNRYNSVLERLLEIVNGIIKNSNPTDD